MEKLDGVEKASSYLQQLQVMGQNGFCNLSENVRALVKHQGNAHAAMTSGLVMNWNDSQAYQNQLTNIPKIMTHKNLLLTLKDMGFCDYATNLRLVFKHKGNLEAILPELTDAQNQSQPQVKPQPPQQPQPQPSPR